ncbi:MAG: hypothetical protein V2I97_12555 [Desulfococcaceae bacterium]|jgi:uncharacterized membrane protein|nr:hypothetical protein [Desulfococcaceae bacterium]
MNELKVMLKSFSMGLKAFAEGIEKFSDQMQDAGVKNHTGKEEKAEEDTVKEEKAKEEQAKEEKAPEKAKTAPSGGAAKKKSVKKKTAGKKTKKKNDTDIVLEIILASEKGVGQDELTAKTGFTKNKVHNIVYRLKKDGKIKSEKKGFYEKI